MPFLGDQEKLEGNYAPSHATFFPKSSDQNFEIAIMFRIVEKPNNYFFGYNMTSSRPWENVFKL